MLWKLISSILLAFSLIILFASMVLGFEFDNVKTYDPEKREVTITNAFGFGGDIVKIRLDTPSVYRVLDRGENIDQLVAEFTVESFFDYSDAFKSISFTDLKTEEVMYRDFNYKYKNITGAREVLDYYEKCSKSFVINETVEKCDKIQNGSHLEYNYEWILIDESKEQFKKGNLTFGIFLDVKEGEDIEWIPKMFGFSIPEWARWTAEFNDGLLFYYRMNETASPFENYVDGSYNASVNDSITFGITGIDGEAAEFNGSNEAVPNTGDLGYLDFTLSVWYNVSVLADKDTLFEGGYADNDGGILWFRTDTTSLDFLHWEASTGTTISISDPPVDGKWQHVVVTFNDASNLVSIYINGSLADSTELGFLGRWMVRRFGCGYTWGSMCLYGGLDEIGIWNRTLSDDEVSDLYNNESGIFYDPDATPTEYNLTILSPLTASPLEVDVFDNMTLTFTLMEEGVNLTSGVTINNVTIDGNHSDILQVIDSGRFAADFETFTTTLGDWVTSYAVDAGCVWQQDTDGTGSSSTGPCAGASNCGTNDAGYDDNEYAYVETSSGDCNTATGHAYLDYEDLDMDSYTNVNFTFAYSMYGADMGNLSVQVDDGVGGWDILWSLTGDQGSSPEYVFVSLNLSSYSGTRDIRFDYDRNGDTGFYGDVAIDVLNITGDFVSSIDQLWYSNKWNLNITVPNVTAGLKDLFLNVSYGAIVRNTTEPQSINISGAVSPPADSCTCAGADTNWEVDMSDYCNVTSDCGIDSGNLTFINTGAMRCNSTMNMSGFGNLNVSMTFYVLDACALYLL